MKLSKRIQKIISREIEAMIENKKIAGRIEGGCKNLPEWFKQKPAAYYHGMADARASMIELVLMQHNCYSGFYEVNDKVHGFNYSYNRYFLDFDVNDFLV